MKSAARLTARDLDNTDWLRDLSVSHNCVGRVLRALDKLADALREFEADLAIAERLASLDPTNAQWQEDLAAARRALAELRKQIG